MTDLAYISAIRNILSRINEIVVKQKLGKTK